jgi:hypothetical protein
MAGRAIDIGIIIREQFPERAKRGGIDLGVGRQPNRRCNFRSPS